MFGKDFPDKPFTTAEFCNLMGKISKEKSKHPEKSFITTAYDYDVPVYISTMKDSSLALNLAVQRLNGKIYNLDFVREIIEQAAILFNSKKSGIVELGGGVPKNTAQQTGPLLDQILRRNDGGQDYIIQITDARPDTGGLSGATLQEGKSWGKVQDAHEGIVTVYADNAIYNKINNNTYFSKDVRIEYLDNLIYSDNLDLMFTDKISKVYNNVIFKNNNLNLFTDKISINMVTGNIKLDMYNNLDKVRLITEYEFIN